MTAEDLAHIYAQAFQNVRAWSTDEITSFLTSPLCFAAAHPEGFAIGRVIADEAELITIAVHPDKQGSGIGYGLLREYETIAKARGAARSFLEVASDNTTAITLYERVGYTQNGMRRAYYTRNDGSTCDALLLEKWLT